MTTSNDLQVEQIDSLVDAAGLDGTRDIMDAFWRSTQSLLSEMETHLSAADFGETIKSAHSLKGSAANIGAVKLAATASAIETACRSEDLQNAGESLTLAREDFAKTRASIEARLDAIK